MTDNPRYRNTEMNSQEATEYAFEELGDRFHEVKGSEIPNSVRGFLSKVRNRDSYVRGYAHEGGYVVETELGDQIINPKEFIGQKPRFWIGKDLLNVYFKKEGEYYLLRFNL